MNRLNISVLRNAATDAPEGGTGTAPARETVAVSVNPLLDKVTQMAADKAKNKPKARLELTYDPQRKDMLVFEISKADFLSAVGPSSTGTSNGCTMVVQGQFDFEIGGKTFSFTLDCKGGWATVKASA